MIPEIKLISISITFQNYLFWCFTFVFVRMLKIHSPSKFSVWDTVLLTIITKLYTRSSELIHHLYNCKFVPTYQPLSISLPASHAPQPHSWQHQSTLYICELDFFFFEILCVSDTMQYWSFFAWLISLNLTSFGFIHVVANGKISFFSWLNNIPSYTYTTFSLSIHLLTDA